MLLRDLKVKPGFVIHFSTQFTTVGYWGPIVHIMISEVSEWQLADELLRQEDGLKEVFITPTATFASSRPLEPSLYLSTYYSLARSRLSLSLISRGPGPRSALPTGSIDHGVLPHLRD